MAERSQTKKIVLIIVLAVALAAVLFFQFGGLRGGSGKNVTPGAAPFSNPGGEASMEPNEGTLAVPLKVAISWNRPEAVGPIARDPMRMDVPKALLAAGSGDGEPNNLPRLPDQPRFVVTGIIFSTEQPSCVIVDGHILHEGDTIYGATVGRITEEYAEISRGDKKWTIKPGQTNQEP
jgi:hypothetical protein